VNSLYMTKKAGKQNAAVALEYHTVVSVPAVQQRQRVAASTAVVAGSKKIVKNERVTVQVSLFWYTGSQRSLLVTPIIITTTIISSMSTGRCVCISLSDFWRAGG
jgi:hypothetical protein